MIIIYTNKQRLFRVFNSELVLGILVLLTVVTGILAALLHYQTLVYVAICLCILIAGFLEINRFLCYRPGTGFFKIKRLR